MKKWMTALLLCVLSVTNICFAEDKKTETETEDELTNIIFETTFKIPPTRSFFIETPEAVLRGSHINLSFEEAVPYAGVSVLDAGSGAVVYETVYAYEAEMEMDLSGFPKGQYILRIETKTATYEGAFSL